LRQVNQKARGKVPVGTSRRRDGWGVVAGSVRRRNPEVAMNGIIYLVGLVVVVLAVLSFFGLS
jgi:hypothetical protein